MYGGTIRPLRPQRHCCKCLFGCTSASADQPEVKMEFPKVKTLFDECEWQEFISQSRPNANTWDIEDRGSSIKSSKRNEKMLLKHKCGPDKYSAMFIDTRRVEDDLPWDETGESILKNTPT